MLETEIELEWTVWNRTQSAAGLIDSKPAKINSIMTAADLTEIETIAEFSGIKILKSAKT